MLPSLVRKATMASCCTALAFAATGFHALPAQGITLKLDRTWGNWLDGNNSGGNGLICGDLDQNSPSFGLRVDCDNNYVKTVNGINTPLGTTSEVLWGIPNNTSSQPSRLIFEGRTPKKIISDEENFLLGVFTHDNKEIEAGNDLSALLRGVDLEIGFRLEGNIFDDGFLEHSFTVSLEIDETINNFEIRQSSEVSWRQYETCRYISRLDNVSCPDLISLAKPIADDAVKIGGKYYTLEIIDLSELEEIISPLPLPYIDFLDIPAAATPENGQESAPIYVFGRLTNVPPLSEVPEPSYVLGFVSFGVIGIGLFRKSRSSFD
ncbi:MAG: hypothetical protein F6K42_28030 [Leptolyngbya sp. SIO1D8]|nr:hypothetical protein [Leptolyngbya sp. SIO1D8]